MLSFQSMFPEMSTQQNSAPICQRHFLQIAIRGSILKLLLRPEIDSKESIPPAYVARWAGTRSKFLLGSWPHRLFKNSSTECPYICANRARSINIFCQFFHLITEKFLIIWHRYDRQPYCLYININDIQ
jgi:hypothetical protein